MSDQHLSPDEPSADSLIHRNQLLSQEIRRRVDQLAAINTVAATVSQSLDLETTLQTALGAVLDVIKVDAAGISLVDELAGELVLRAQRGWKYDFVSRPMRIPMGQGISGMVIRNDAVIVTGDLSNDPRLAVPEFAEEHVQAMAMVPMHARSRVVGILSVMNYATYKFTDEDITVLRAIADQVGIALDNARLYESAREQSSRLSAVLHSSGDAIIATNNRGRINLVNSAAESLFGIRAGEIIRSPLRHAPIPAPLLDGLRRAMSHERAGNTAFEVTLEDGRLLSTIVSPVYARQPLQSDQKAEGWVMVVRDVTHLRQAEQARINFIQSAAHDLRNPLGATLSALTILHRDLGQDESHEEIISIALQSVDRMQDLIDDLLSLEHIESGVGLQFNLLDVRDLIERGMTDIKPPLQQKDQTLLLEVPEVLPPILGDMRWLHRALLNLLYNANKYTQMGGEITIRAYTQERDLYLEIQDNGPGIPADAQPRLFERFYRGPATEQGGQTIKGTGLGLAIVKSIAEQHGGRVFAQSRIGRGSIFGMILPLAEAS